MKKFVFNLCFGVVFVLCICSFLNLFCPNHKPVGKVYAGENVGLVKDLIAVSKNDGVAEDVKASGAAELKQKPIMAIIIDDFGGYDRNGIEEMLKVDAPLTCAVIPFADNTKIDANLAEKAGKEVVLHLPMASHVRLPQEWYGKVYIDNNDDAAAVKNKIDSCLAEVPQAKGANIHIGSGACQNEVLMAEVMGELKEKGLFFCDSRTHENTKCERAANACGVAYLGRDVFLEPHGLGGYNNACHFLKEAAKIATEKGYSIAIGHVGSEGGVATAKAIADTLAEIKGMGVEIVPLSQVYAQLSNN